MFPTGNQQPPTSSHPDRLGSGPRWLFHVCLLLAFAALSGVLLVWPQWVAADGARTALAIQQERERDLEERLELARSLAGRLQGWQRETRRVFLSEELTEYPTIVREAARQSGANLKEIEVTNRTASRWRAIHTQPGGWADDGVDLVGEIQPRAVRIVLRGRFEGVYRAVATLCQQQQLFIPDRWMLASGPRPGAGMPPGELQAEIWATVFVVRELDETPKLPARALPDVPADPAENEL